MLSQSVQRQAASAQTAADKCGGYSSHTWLPFALCLLLLCNAENKLLLRVLHACITFQAVQNCVMQCCRLKCLSLQHELHNELKVLRCEKYVQEAMSAIEADAEQQVRGLCWCNDFTLSRTSGHHSHQ